MARSLAGQKRRAAPDDYDEDSGMFENIQIASPGPKSGRPPLREVEPAQAQNKHRRVLQCVLIPKQPTPRPHCAEHSVPSRPRELLQLSSSSSSSPSTSAQPFQNALPAHVLDDAPAQQGRPKRAVVRQSYVPELMSADESEDELASKIHMPARKVPVRPETLSQLSNFEDSSISNSTVEGFSDGAASDDAASTASSRESLVVDDPAPRIKRKPVPARKFGGERLQSATGKSKSKATASNMKKLLRAWSGPSSVKGLDTSLPPLYQIDDIFADITKKAVKLDLEKVLEHLGNRPLRIATMCSGTESPLLAVQKIQASLESLSSKKLNIEHVFSAEIVPFKQAYIERNFKPPIIFRDILELIDVIDDEVPMATTAYGAKVRVPTDIHVVIAGTSCVDFSNLNKHKKGLTDGGESGKTWDAVLAFCKAFRPPIVLLENVKSAPWDSMLEEYCDAGYEAAGALVDSKDFYIPQTRQRGFMVCFDKHRLSEAGVKSPGEEWHALLGQFRRYASSPVSDFLLPNDQVRRKQGHLDEPKREVDWSRCEITQMQYRQDKRLGTARPYTHWQESGSITVPESGVKSWYHSQVERVLDSMDASLLRKALRENGMYDVRFKTRIWDLSQNIYMNEDTSSFGGIGCITPTGQLFISDAGRALAPEEALILQGIPLNQISFTTETPAELQDLAGNAMTSTVVGSAFLSALIAGHKLIDNFDHSVSSRSTESSQLAQDIELISGRTESNTVVSGQEATDVSNLLEQAERAMRRCCCEGSGGPAAKPIQKCVDCDHTTCTACGGEPSHNYRQRQQQSKRRTSPLMFEERLRSQLPLRVTLDLIGDLRRLALSKAAESELLTGYFGLIREIEGVVFTLSTFRRTHCLTVTYRTERGRLELVLDDFQAEWRLFITSPDSLAANDWLRQTLRQPVARSLVSDSLFGNHWSWRVPTATQLGAKISGHGARVPTWWSRMEMPDFRDHWQPDSLTIKIQGGKATSVDRSLEGVYKYLPNCGTACESLYKKVDTCADQLPLYLFLDPTRVGAPGDDSFVLSTNKSRLEYDEIRCILARVEPSWRPWDHGHSQNKVNIIRDCEWVQLPDNGTLRPHASALEIRKPKDILSTTEALTCSDALAAVRCDYEPSSDSYLAGRGGRMMIGPDDTRFFSMNAWQFEAVRRQLGVSDWHSIKAPSAADSCHSCAPRKPLLKWQLGEDGESISPYEDTRDAAVYEEAIKRRPAAVVVNVQPSKGRIELGLNLVTLAHRARARLPSSDEVIFQWRLSTNSTSSNNFKFRSFHLSSTKDVVLYDKDLDMSVELFPKQRLSLAWMREQEAGSGQEILLEEAEEASLPHLGWTIEVRAKTSMYVRGGICADHPGFGKSVTSLALIQAQFLESDSAEILEDLRSRQTAHTSGLLPTTATLIVCPGTLVKQWRAEIDEKLGFEGGVFVINTILDLARYQISDFESAKIIVVNRSVLGSEKYAERLAAFAAIPGPATSRGRAFGQWLKFATKQIPDHLRILKESGASELRKRIKARYAQNVNSDSFKTVVPSRRLRGKDFAAASDKKKSRSETSRPAPSAINTDCIESPLFELFFWNRIIVDEFHLLENREYHSVTALKADKRWGLSGTPALGDFYDVAQMAGLIGAPLRIGSDTRAVMKIKNIRDLRKDMTDFERFDAMRQGPSDRLHSQIYELDQKFLDKFLRRNIMDFAEMKYQDHLVPVALDLDHRAIYTELSQHLNSLDMRIKKGSKSKSSDSEQRLYQAVAECTTAEEALSKTAAFFERKDNSGACHKSGLKALIELREREADQYIQTFQSAVAQAKTHEPNAFESWKQARIDGSILGDEETSSAIQAICNTASTHSQRKASAATKKKKNSDNDQMDQKTKDSGRGLTSKANALANRVLVSTRSLRFLQKVHLAQRASVATTSKVSKCDSPECQSQKHVGQDVAISAYCGHMLCKQCYEKKQKIHVTQCPARGCSASMLGHHMLLPSKRGDLQDLLHTPFGAKIEAAMDLLEKIAQKRDQAILFVHYENQLKEVKSALSSRDISGTVVDEPRTAGQQIADFRADRKKTVIVLNASDETAAGSNLQNANHVIFLSPLLRDTQYGYDSTMAQAIGRVRRHGQKKEIHVYRIIALDTIDVDILEHRERRTDSLTEQGTAKIVPPRATKQHDMNKEPVAERCQLVKEDGKFSLRPHAWLVRCGADGDDDDDDSADMAKVKGKNRVGGWEDFSSLVKFSRAYTEDDD